MHALALNLSFHFSGAPAQPRPDRIKLVFSREDNHQALHPVRDRLEIIRLHAVAMATHNADDLRARLDDVPSVYSQWISNGKKGDDPIFKVSPGDVVEAIKSLTISEVRENLSALFRICRLPTIPPTEYLESAVAASERLAQIGY